MDPSTSTRDGAPNSECLRRGTFSILIFGASDPKIIKNSFELKICLVYLNAHHHSPAPELTKNSCFLCRFFVSGFGHGHSTLRSARSIRGVMGLLGWDTCCGHASGHQWLGPSGCWSKWMFPKIGGGNTPKSCILIRF